MSRDLAAILRGSDRALVWREIHWPGELAVDAGLGVLRQLATDHLVQFVAFEVEATAGRVAYRIGLPASAALRVEQLLSALVPGSATTDCSGRTEFLNAWRIGLTTRHRPLQTTSPREITTAVLAAVTAVVPNEKVVLQWMLGRAQAPRQVTISEPSSTVEPWWRPLIGSSSGPLDTERRRALQTKRGDHSFGCVGRVAVRAATAGRTRALAVGILAGLRIAEAPGVGLKLIRERGGRLNRCDVPWRWPYALNVSELVGLLAWPLGDQPLPGVPRDSSRWLRPDARVKSNKRVLGRATSPGDESLVGLSIDDARHHLHVLGPTGVGKSTLLASLITQDIAAGRGVVVIEPKGDLVADVLGRIPRNRLGDVVVLDPTESNYPVGLNPLLSRGRHPELIADQVLAVFHGLYEHNWGPRMQDILHASLLTLAGRGDASLCALPALLTNPAVRGRLRSGVDDPIALEPFWGWFDAISDAERQQAVAPVLNKLRPFLLRKSVRAIVGQVEPRFRIDEVFTKRKIVLVSLAKGLIGPEAAALLGSLFVAELWQAILGRGSVAAERRHTVTVYADEFQDYVHLPTDMADALAQARGLGVGLTLAHQHLGQLPANLRSAVMANARSRVCFQLAGEDAQVMARLSGGILEPNDFQRLHRYEAYAQLVAGGEVTSFASMRTLPMQPPTSDAAEVRAMSRTRYGRPVSDVEAEIRRLIEGQPDDQAPVGRRRRGEQ